MRLTLWFALVATISLNAQIAPTVLLRGTVRDGSQPARVDILFRDEQGNTIRAKSAHDGSYQAVLPPGHKYSVTITNDNLERYTFSYEIPPMTKYTELTQDFSIGSTFASTGSDTQSSNNQSAKPTKKRAKVKKSKRSK